MVATGLAGALAFGVLGPNQAFAASGGNPGQPADAANSAATANADNSAATANADNGNGGADAGNGASAPGQLKQDDTATPTLTTNTVTVTSKGDVKIPTSSSVDSGINPGHTKTEPNITAQPPSTPGTTGEVKDGFAGSHDTGNFPDILGNQPLSTADQNTGGANGQCPDGPYCSTRDAGQLSGNGNGDGNAYGKPCAGCVGKADNKNPQGQKPGGKDGNAGYECDSNRGIGQTNPAHTGCKDADTTEVCPDGTTGTPPNCETPECPAGSAHSTKPCNDTDEVCPAGTDNAGTAVTPCDDEDEVCPAGTVGTPPNCHSPGCPAGEVRNDAGDCVGPTDVLGEVIQKPVVVTGVALPAAQQQKPPVEVLGEKVTRGPLPFTGTDAVGLATTSALLLLGGTVLLLLGRRRRRSE